MQRSAIEWTEATWIPVTGCTQISPGCAHCYALTFAERFRGVPGHPCENGFDLQLRPGRLAQPLRWKKPRTIFVNSMSDLFHPERTGGVHPRGLRSNADCRSSSLSGPDEAVGAFGRNGRLSLPWPQECVDGCVGRESAVSSYRVDDLREVPAAVRFLSCEPLLGSSRPRFDRYSLGDCRRVRVDRGHVQWSRPGPCRCEISVGRRPCRSSSSSGGAHDESGRRVGKKRAGNSLGGELWRQMPEVADVA